MFEIGLTDHLEGPVDRPSAEVYAEVADLVRRADRLGVKYAWFTEHHAHAHQGHLPTPLLFALHLTSQTKQIRLGTAVICLNLHSALDIAEQVAVMDVLSNGRTAIGFGSGSTPQEIRLFGKEELGDDERHRAFEASLRLMLDLWRKRTSGMLPVPPDDLAGRCWVAVNSVAAARIAGRLNLGMLFSHLRTPQQYGDYCAAYRAAGGTGRVSANRPVFVGRSDDDAMREAEPMLRILWRRFRAEGKIPVDTPEPQTITGLCAHPINFIVGGPESVARQLFELHRQVPFDVANLEIRWDGLSHEQVSQSLDRLMTNVVPLLR